MFLMEAHLHRQWSLRVSTSLNVTHFETLTYIRTFWIVDVQSWSGRIPSRPSGTNWLLQMLPFKSSVHLWSFVVGCSSSDAAPQQAVLCECNSMTQENWEHEVNLWKHVWFHKCYCGLVSLFFFHFNCILCCVLNRMRRSKLAHHRYATNFTMHSVARELCCAKLVLLQVCPSSLSCRHRC
jgi:hypothetical protein